MDLFDRNYYFIMTGITSENNDEFYYNIYANNAKKSQSIL